MDGLQLAFLAMLVVGGAFLIISLFVGELSDIIGPDTDISGTDGPGWTSPTIMAGALTAYGVTGFVATESGLDGIWSVLIGAAVAGVVGYVLIGILRSLARQQGNSQISGQSFLGLSAVVILSIPPGGKGEVQFRDRNGVVVRRPATSTWSQIMPEATEVIIKDVLADHVVVSRT